jgi:hypothetical protein
MTEVNIDTTPQQMFALICDNEFHEQSNELDIIIKASSKGAAWNKLLSQEYIFSLKPAYYLFEIDKLKFNPNTNSVVACDPEHIKFKFTPTSSLSIGGNEARKYFKQFCKNTFGKVQYKMTNEQFADNYNKLADWFVYGDNNDYDGGCTKEPYKEWDLKMIPLTHFDSADKYVVCESNTRCFRDASPEAMKVFSSSTEYKPYNFDEEDEDDVTTPKYFSYPMSSIEFL